MAYTYSKIATVTVGSGGASSIDFLAIPQNYTDLKIVSSLRSDRAAVTSTALILYAFNGDTGSTLSRRWLLGNGSAASSASGSNANSVQISSIPAATATTNTFSNDEIYISKYTSSNYKPLSIDSVCENNATEGLQFFTAGLWRNSAPINSLKIVANAGNFVQYSTATLYGIKAEV